MNCDFLKRQVMRVPDEDNPGIEERITYYDCRMDDQGLDCPYPAILCKFKEQCEEFYNFVLAAKKRAEN